MNLGQVYRHAKAAAGSEPDFFALLKVASDPEAAKEAADGFLDARAALVEELEKCGEILNGLDQREKGVADAAAANEKLREELGKKAEDTLKGELSLKERLDDFDAKVRKDRADLAARIKELADREEKLSGIENELGQKAEKLEKLAASLEAQQARIDRIQRVLNGKGPETESE